MSISPNTSAQQTVEVLTPEQWAPRQAAHEAAVDELTAGRLERAKRQIAHPVEDFLFSYYPLKPAQLRRWHPGYRVGLVYATDHAQWRFYRTTMASPSAVTRVDLDRFITERAHTFELIRRLLPATNNNPAHFGCFGLHEWAMVYRQESGRRHGNLPLRLSAKDTDEVVESHPIKCSHFDAFRFFTPAARKFNLLQPDVDSRIGMEQPGCLHANMDLYKWAYKLLPVVPSELVLDCFRLAREIRILDMRASPYDLSAFDLTPVQIENPAGKGEYVAAQRDFAERAGILRDRLIDAIPAH